MAAASRGCKRLILAPEGDLVHLPFEILPLDDGRHLLDVYAISYVGTGRDTLRFGRRPAVVTAEPIVVADPDLNLDRPTTSQAPSTSSPKASFWARLFGRNPAASEQPEEGPSRQAVPEQGRIQFNRRLRTRVEGEQMARLLHVRPWLDAQASKTRLLACHAPRILHLAAPGFYLGNPQPEPNPEPASTGAPAPGPSPDRTWGNPLLRSGLALAGANLPLDQRDATSAKDDGLLTAKDVSRLDLLATELVVLSDCVSAAAFVPTGSSVLGLRRCFLLAEAQTLVTSLWIVPEKQRLELLKELYGRVLAGESRSEALRAAQSAVKARYPDPFYWGAFVCYGDPGPLD
jgi:hypothetical protein